LVDFLSEALALSHIHKEIYNKVIFRKFSPNSLEADLEGAPAEFFDEDIKAVTYHEADVKKDAKGNWSAAIIFDI
ncbi:MAG: archease, partial [Patescibacteria group bacterium]